MGAHLIDGEFQSDKYQTTPRGKVPLSVRDPSAQGLLWEYARRRRAVDAEFSDDLEAALRLAGYDPESWRDPAVVLQSDPAGPPPAVDRDGRDERTRYLRSSIRAAIAYYLQEEIDGGELYKETWEECRGGTERGVVKDELRALLAWLRPADRDGRLVVSAEATNAGTYIASRATLPERSAAWRRLRDVDGWKITSSWIDEAGPGETPDLGSLWVRIESEIARSERLILYVEAGDLPLKGALIEVGMAIAHGIPVRVVAPGVVLDPTSLRPLGAWVRHPLVAFCDTMDEALAGATFSL
jgi:hypothetical protein